MRKEAALMPVIGCDTHGFMRMKVGSLVKYTVRVGGEPGFVFGVVKEVHSEGKVVVAYTITVRNHGSSTKFFKDVRVSASRVSKR